jgi:hypothetical protein
MTPSLANTRFSLTPSDPFTPENAPSAVCPFRILSAPPSSRRVTQPSPGKIRRFGAIHEIVDRRRPFIRIAALRGMGPAASGTPAPVAYHSDRDGTDEDQATDRALPERRDPRDVEAVLD